MMKWRSVAAAVGVGVVVLLAAACGGSSGSDEATTTQAAEATTTQAAEAATTQAAEAATTVESAGKLVGTVGPGFTITLTQDGAPVTELPAGAYEIVVDDKADIHNFHLTGPGVDESTEVEGTGSVTWAVTLEAGEYKFVCDPHASTMNGSFTVT